MRKAKVLICGASIGGPALAYWLHRYGFEVTVVERAPGPRPGGQAIDVRGPALDVLERMGVLEEVRRHGTGLRGMSMVDDEGRELFSTTERTASGGDLESPDVEILRDDLAAILYTAGEEQIDYVFDDAVAALEQDAEEVRVVFRSGAARTFDLVVGADGVHSDTRRLVFGPEEKFLRHLGGYLGVWTVPNELGLHRWQVVYQMPGNPWGAMIMSVRDDTEARVYVGIESPEPPAGFLPPSAREQKQLVADRFAKAGWQMPRLLEHMWDAPDFHFDAMAQIHMDSWTQGRVALLGDAGYCGSPASGQGTTMALVGAYVLAGELGTAEGDHRTAFTAYGDRLRAYVAANQELALTNIAQMRARHPDFSEDAMAAPSAEAPRYETPDIIDGFQIRDY
ncbi:FAD-dependent monooxygenase [Actinomadura sp. NPDC000600]|uniref:FAD-dependent monooxygenase n=1 Tax=Actinomadura sp. NPDC000600 TaxID=3154262 RepID=UPI0033950E49